MPRRAPFHQAHEVAAEGLIRGLFLPRLRQGAAAVWWPLKAHNMGRVRVILTGRGPRAVSTPRTQPLARRNTGIRSTGRSIDTSTHAPWRPTFMGGRRGSWGSRGLRCRHASSRPHGRTCSRLAYASTRAIGSSMQTTRAVAGWSSASGGGSMFGKSSSWLSWSPYGRVQDTWRTWPTGTGSTGAGSAISEGRHSVRTLHCKATPGIRRLSRERRSVYSRAAAVGAARPPP